MWLQRYVAAAFGLVTTVTAASCNVPSDESVEVSLGQHRLCVPTSYLRETRIPDWIRPALPHLPPSDPTLPLDIDEEDVAHRVEGFALEDGTYARHLLVSIRSLSDEDLQWYLDPETHVYSDPWYGRGLFEDQTVEQYAPGLYKITSPKALLWWRLFKKPPDPSSSPPADPFTFFAASCYDSDSPKIPGATVDNCRGMFFHEGLFFEYRLYGENAKLVESVGEYVKNLFDSWRTFEDC